MIYLVYLLIFLSVLIGVAGQLLMKHGVTQIGEVSSLGALNFLLRAALSPWIVGGIIAYVIGTIFWLFILSKVNVSYAYPMLSLGYVLLLFFAAFFLGEQVSPIRYAGVILIVLGVFLITRS